jgi:putative ABC transport system ATP-binding protein
MAGDVKGRSTDAPVVLEARKVSKIYQMGEVEVPALREVDFALHESEFLVLLGASAAASPPS